MFIWLGLWVGVSYVTSLWVIVRSQPHQACASQIVRILAWWVRYFKFFRVRSNMLSNIIQRLAYHVYQIGLFHGAGAICNWVPVNVASSLLTRNIVAYGFGNLIQ